jgi:hypothetical protein
MKHLAVWSEGECWEPVDENDKGLLSIAENAIFRNTTFPSGWVSPDKILICKEGKLHNETTISRKIL